MSGGLDSIVSMALAQQELEIILAITFDYGQKARLKEISYSTEFCKLFDIKHKIISLPFMQDLQSSLNEACEDNISPWVPNRNGVFINIAAAYAENYDAQFILCGFNLEEAVSFPDNSIEFIKSVNKALYYSTLNHVELKSYVDNMNKVEIINKAKELGINLSKVWSCYRGGDIPCGDCPSCLCNNRAYEKAGVNYLENHDD